MSTQGTPAKKDHFLWYLLAGLTIGLIAVGAFAVYQLKGMVQGLSGPPVYTAGESFMIGEGIRYTPPAGWQIIKMPPFIGQNGAGLNNVFEIGRNSQLSVMVVKGEDHPISQNNTVNGAPNWLLDKMNFKFETTAPQIEKINGKEWHRFSMGMGPKDNAAQGASTMVACGTSGSGYSVVLLFAGAEAEKDWGTQQVEALAATFQFN